MSLRPNARTESRRNRYKVAVDADDGRRRRADSMVEIRKSKREERLLKKRREDLQDQDHQFPHTSTAGNKLESLPNMVAGVFSVDNQMQLEATTQIIELLSIEESPPIEEVIQAGLVPRFVEFLQREDFPQLQFKAAWALTNITSGNSENTKVVIDHGVVPIFLKLLGSPRDNVRKQAVWALGNVAADSPKSRDLVLGSGALVPLLAQLNENSNLSMLKIASWTLSILCNGNPEPLIDQVRLALFSLKYLVHSNDEEVLANACWALYYLSHGPNDMIQAVIETGVCQRLVELLMHPTSSVLSPALHTVCNIVAEDNAQTQGMVAYIRNGETWGKSSEGENIYYGPYFVFLKCMDRKTVHVFIRAIRNLTTQNVSQFFHQCCDAGFQTTFYFIISSGVLPRLWNLLTGNHKSYIKKEACWLISIITAGNNTQIEAVIRAGLVGVLVNLLQIAEFDIKKEAALAISNATSGGSPEQIKYLVNQNCIKPLCDLLVCPDPRTIMVCLQGLENIIKVGEAEKNLGTYGDVNRYARLIYEAEGWEKIENLQLHDFNQICEKAVEILETYWFEEVEEEV